MNTRTVLFTALLSAGMCVPVFAELMPDDHGNIPAHATALPGGSNTIAGVIDYDTDADVFSFPFLPWRSYVIRVETGTVWDVRLEVIPPDWGAIVWHTNTAWTTSALNAGWTNAAAASRWYLAVSGLFRFTTGSYHLAVWEAPGQDTDSDGIADSWEMHYFGNLTTANATSDYNEDNFLDLHAYLAGVSPMSALVIEGYSHGPDRDELSWMSAPYGTYEISSATNIFGPWTLEAQRMAGMGGGMLVWTNQAGSGPQQFYRVEFRY